MRSDEHLTLFSYLPVSLCSLYSFVRWFVQWFVRIRQWFVMGAMLLASALNRGISPCISDASSIFPGDDFRCSGHWLRTWRPCAVLHAQWQTLTLFSIYLSLFVVSTLCYSPLKPLHHFSKTFGYTDFSFNRGRSIISAILFQIPPRSEILHALSHPNSLLFIPSWHIIQNKLRMKHSQTKAP